jgi:hypothetical protein
MGLKEKQAMASLDFGWAEKRVLECTGTPVKIELDVNGFSNDLDAIYYADQRGAVTVANGIAKVCYNDIGKEAFNEKKISKILLKNQPAGNRSISFENESLVLAFAFASGDDYFSEGELAGKIEEQL